MRDFLPRNSAPPHPWPGYGPEVGRIVKNGGSIEHLLDLAHVGSILRDDVLHEEDCAAVLPSFLQVDDELGEARELGSFWTIVSRGV